MEMIYSVGYYRQLIQTDSDSV